MGNKKKFPGKLSLFCGLLFCLLLGPLSTSCFARTTLTESEAKYIFDYFFTTNYSTNSTLNFQAASATGTSKSDYNANDYLSFMNWFNNNNDIDIHPYTTIFWIKKRAEAGRGSIYYSNFNTGSGTNNLSHLYFYVDELRSSSDKLSTYIFAIDDNHNIVDNYEVRRLDFYYDNIFSFDTLTTIYLKNMSNWFNNDNYWVNKHNDWNYTNYINGNPILENIDGLVSLANANSIYSNYNGFQYLNVPTPFLLQTFYTPPIPSGDIVPDTGNTGQITNNSGETTGNIDLSGIQNGIGNINQSINEQGQAIIENQNQNTQTIINAFSGETEKITNTLTDNADDLIDNTIITSGDIESALNFEIAHDPYSNFWLTLTNNLKSALLGTKRSIDISFQGTTWTISLDEYLVLPAWLVIILTPFSTAFFTWVLVRQFKLIFDKLASGNVDSLLKENSEERHF